MGLKIDGIATSAHIDSSGEILNVEGHDITELEEGKGVLNWEHSNKSSEDIIGKIIYAKKILSRSDCSNDRERKYWDYVKAPFVYIIAEFFDDENHPGAVAAAAIVRYYHNRKEKLLAGFSIEGATLKREGNVLERSIGRRVAFTLRPCNKTCIAEVLEDPQYSEVVKKSMGSRTEGLVEVDDIVLEDKNVFKNSIIDLKKTLQDLNKTLTAGNYNVAPSSLTGGAALQVEDRSLRNRIKAAIRDWNRTRPLKEAIKAALPEVSDEYIDHFTEIAEDLTLKKGYKPLVRLSKLNLLQNSLSEDQIKLVEGVYIDPQNFDLNSEYSNKGIGKNDAGYDVIFKGVTELLTQNNPVLYYKIAKDFFGLQNHVLDIALVQHNELNEGKPFYVIRYYPDAILPYNSFKKYEEVLKSGRDLGWLYKLFLVDQILGNQSKNYSDLLIYNNKIINADNDLAFSYTPTYPIYVKPYGDYSGILNDLLDYDTINWLQSLNTTNFINAMKKNKADDYIIKNSLFRLKLLQKIADKNYTVKDIIELIATSKGRKNQYV